MRVSDGGGNGALDTHIDGRPESVRAVADWLTSTVAPAVDGGAVALHRAGAGAAAGWQGQAGLAFGHRMDQARPRVDALGERILVWAGTLAAYADLLDTALQRMAAIRDRARAEGLLVVGDRILQVGEDAEDALERLAAEVVAVHDAMDAAQARLGADYRGLGWEAAILATTDFVQARMGDGVAYRSRQLRSAAAHYDELAARAQGRLATTDYAVVDRVGGSGAGRRVFDADARHQADMADRAAEAGRRADDYASGPGRYATVAKNVSRGLVGVGVAVDLSNGESVTQAVASNVGGYAAGAAVGGLAAVGSSMAVGALVGSSVPVVGTAVGAVVGLGVGIVASGAIDSLFTKGPDVGQAFADGMETLTDTVGAAAGITVDAVSGAASEVGDMVSGLFD